MADKSTNFVIKVNSKEVDLAKTSFKDFKKIIADAKKELQSIPISDPRYKQLATDINGAEKAWKEATKSAAEFNDENEEGAGQVRSYRSQIKELELELIGVEQQFGKNSDRAASLRARLGELRDQQAELKTTTQDLDDSLAALPGPIGKIGQAMSGLENLTRNASGAFGNLSKQFPILDSAWKATGIGLLVGLLLGLVAAVVKAAQSFKPLQDAFAGLQDAFGAIMDALKPVTDFLLNIFVGAIKLVADAITGLASVFGGVNNGFKTTTLQLDREIKKQEVILNNYGTFLSEYYAKQLNLLKKYNEERKAILEDELKTADQKNKELFAIDAKYNLEKSILEKQREKITRDNKIKVDNIEREAAKNGIDNQRANETASLNSQKQFQNEQADSEIKAANGRIIRTNVLIKTLQAKDAVYFKETIDALQKSVDDEKLLIADLGNEKIAQQKLINTELAKQQRERLREDISIVAERSIAIQQLTTELIKEENARNLQAAKDSLVALKEQQRKETEQAELAGVTKTKLKEKQAAEIKAADENIRKAQIQLSAFLIQEEIDRQDRLATESGIGTQEYFDARRKQLNEQFQQEILLADGNQNKILNARTKFWKESLELDKQGIQAQINLIQLEYDGLFEGTKAFFDKQRQLELVNFELRKKEYQGNYDAIEALTKQHTKNMQMINAAEVQSSADLTMRKFQALGTMRQEFFDVSVSSENQFYEAEKLRAGDNAAALEVIELEHNKRLAQIDADRIEARNSVYAAIAQITSEFGNVLSDIAQQQLQAAQGNDKARFESAKKFAKAAVLVERVGAIGQVVANTGIANAKAVAASPITFGQPWVTINTISAAVSIAGIIAAAVKSINDINSQQFEPAGGTGGNRMGRGYAKGGVIEGNRHSQGGVLIEAEGGEAVMTRGAVTMFGPMLNMMNQMGGGTNFAPNLTTTLMDKPIVANPAEEQAPMVVKTYVVEKDLTDAQQRQARLKNLSTL